MCVTPNVFPLLVDEEKIFRGNQPDPMWEQFANVATDLLERLQACMSINSSPLGSDFENDVDLPKDH